MPESKWYVVHTYSGYENKVAESLEKMVENNRLHEFIHEVRIPTEKIVEIKDGKQKERESKLFPGYVFVKMVMTDDSWFVVRNTRGCTGFVGPGGKPLPLPEEEVLAMGIEKRQIEINYEVGDAVTIIDGPLENFSGVVDEIDTEKNKVRLTISMFGRETPVELELDQVARMD